MNLETNLPNEMAWGLAHCCSSGDSCPGSRSYWWGKAWNLKDCLPNASGSLTLGSSQSLRTLSSSASLLSFSLSPLSLSLPPSFSPPLPTPKFTQNPILTPLLTFIPQCWNYQLTSTFPSSYAHSKLSSFRKGTGSTLPGSLVVRQCWFQKLLNK